MESCRVTSQYGKTIRFLEASGATLAGRSIFETTVTRARLAPSVYYLDADEVALAASARPSTARPQRLRAKRAIQNCLGHVDCNVEKSVVAIATPLGDAQRRS